RIRSSTWTAAGWTASFAGSCKARTTARPIAARRVARTTWDRRDSPMSWAGMTPGEIPNYWAYAEHFVLQDHMFAPSDSWTLPSHLFLVSAWSASCADPHDGMSCTSNIDLKNEAQIGRIGEPPVYAWTDITYLLNRAGVSWAYYVDDHT